ncbi:MAG: recombination-associated protein RdgC [Methylococcales bacterium]|nr:recombination-associated protein RdgC [Methylococcales bacterium]
MWFKNLLLYRLTEPFTVSAETLTQQLEAQRFQPCAAQQLESIGWTSPLGRQHDVLLHSSNGFHMVCARTEEKVLPTAVVSELWQERIAEREDAQGYKLARKERTDIKDEVIFELLPKAFSFSRTTYAYIDSRQGWLVVDAASSQKAEKLLHLLRISMGSLPVVPLSTVNNPVTVMTQWLAAPDSAAADVEIEDECELRGEEGGIVRCKRHDLSAPEIKNHLQNGKQVTKLALTYADKLGFVLDEQLTLKRLKFLDTVQDRADDIEGDDEVARFDADFSIMTLELAELLPRLTELFGGEQTRA